MQQDILNIRAFLVSARTGSFSAAAREIGVSPSIVTKRVTRLEDRVGVRLFERTTRRIMLTREGEQLRPHLQKIVRELDDALDSFATIPDGITGTLRVRAPTTVNALHIGPVLGRFQAANPGVSTELVLLDRLVNPLEEGFDLSLGALPKSWPHVVDIPLCRYERVLCAAPDYLERVGRPVHPSDLTDHACLTFLPTGTVWTFEGQAGQIDVQVHGVYSANDVSLLHDAALAGAGLAILNRFMVRADLAEGRLVELMPDNPPQTFWLKALMPRGSARKPALMALIEHLRHEYDPVPPWDRA